LRTQTQNVMEQLTAFADGEALAAVQRRVEMLKSQGVYQELIVEYMDVQQVVVWEGRRAGALAREKYTLCTYRLAADGDRLVDETMFEGDIVYGLIYRDSRWKVTIVREVG